MQPENSPGDTNSEMIKISLPADYISAINKAAQEKGISAREVLTEALEEYVRRESKE